MNARGSRRMGATASLSAAFMTAATPPGFAFRISCATSYTRPPGALPFDGLFDPFLNFFGPLGRGGPIVGGGTGRVSRGRRRDVESGHKVTNEETLRGLLAHGAVYIGNGCWIRSKTTASIRDPPSDSLS